MRWTLTITFALVLTTALPSFAQLTIENPKNIDLPREKAELIYRLTCQVVAEQFHRIGESPSQFPLTLVMGSDDERYTADDKTHTYKIYLKRWDEQLFASSAMMLAIHRLVPRERQQQMLVQILRRANAIAPVSITSLHGRK